MCWQWAGLQGESWVVVALKSIAAESQDAPGPVGCGVSQHCLPQPPWVQTVSSFAPASQTEQG